MLESVLREYGFRYFEYDISTHTLYGDYIGPVIDNDPQKQTNIPESAVESGRVPSDSAKSYLEFYHNLQKGKSGRVLFKYLVEDNVWAWLDCSMRVVFDTEGKPKRAVGFCGDITRMKKVTAENERSRQLNQLVRLLLECVASVEYDYLTFVNKKSEQFLAFASHTKGQLRTGAHFGRLLIDNILRRQTDEDGDELRNALNWHTILRRTKQEGEYIVMVTFVLPGGDKARKKFRFYSPHEEDTDYIVCTCRDITDIYRLEKKHQEEMAKLVEKAQESSRAKGDFLSRMSHDIRTPLNAIIGLNALTFEEAEDPGLVRENLTKMRSASNFLMGLINDILDMSRIEDGAVVLNKEPYGYREFLMNIKTMFEPLCIKANIHFVLDQRNIDTCAFVDKIRFNQIFFNLLSNAVKYTPDGGTVTFRVDHVEENEKSYTFDFVVQDTGIGMSKEFQRIMFEPFSREYSRISSTKQGSGLGLSIAKKLVELMGGTISVESEEGKGSKFLVHLQLEKCKPEDLNKHAIVPGADTEVMAKLQGKNVLLVEDHPLNAEITRRLLEKRGMHVISAENGEEAVSEFSASIPHYFDVILMDIRMPVMDGLEATRAIRALDRKDSSLVPIIATTGDAYLNDIEKSRQAGMNAHLSKPIDPHMLYHEIAAQIR